VEAQRVPVTDVETVLFVSRRDANGAEFDEATHTWSVAGRRARVVIATDGALPAAHVWRADEMRPYLGVAVHGVPNYFLLTGPDIAAQKGYVAKCLAYMGRTGSTRIEVRFTAQRIFSERSRGGPRRGHYWRRVGRRIPSAFEVDSHAGGPEYCDAVYDGPAVVLVDGDRYQAHVRLTGQLDPLDGRYHWRGTVSDDSLEVRLPRDVTVCIGGREAGARLTERTPWSTYAVAGIGAPPFALEEIEVDVSRL
jgi:Domain of unknown function (DUF4873)